MLLSTAGKVKNLSIILERLKVEVDKRLRDELAGFRKDRSCTDQTATLRIILEQSLEWNSPVYATFVDYGRSLIGKCCGSCFFFVCFCFCSSKLLFLLENHTLTYNS